MPHGTSAWISLARLRRRIGKPSPEATAEQRRGFVREYAPDRSFVDVGGLFGLDGEIGFVAEDAGASSVTVFDAGDAYLTSAMRTKEERNSKVRFVQGDLEDPIAVAQVGVHDIVYCCGVIYHSPNPVRQLLHLRAITREFLYLGTHTIPEVPGVEHGCVYYPNLGEASRDAYARAHWRPERLLGIGAPFDDRPMMGHGNFWWGISRSALLAMLTTARFEVIEENRIHESPFHTELIARPVGKDPLLPPVSYFRRCGEARDAGQPTPPWADYYEQRRVGGQDGRIDDL